VCTVSNENLVAVGSKTVIFTILLIILYKEIINVFASKGLQVIFNDHLSMPQKLVLKIEIILLILNVISKINQLTTASTKTLKLSYIR
jgi:hypothetical protein